MLNKRHSLSFLLLFVPFLFWWLVQLCTFNFAHFVCRISFICGGSSFFSAANCETDYDGRYYYGLPWSSGTNHEYSHLRHCGNPNHHHGMRWIHATLYVLTPVFFFFIALVKYSFCDNQHKIICNNKHNRRPHNSEFILL